MAIGIISAVVGTVVAGAVMQKKHSARQNNTLKLPSFSGAVEVKSAVRGRMRLSVPCLANNKELCEHLSAQLGRFSSVKSSNINPVLGSVLICYDENAVEPQLIQAAVIKLLGLEECAAQKCDSTVSKKAKQLKESISLAVSSKTCGILNFSSLLALSLIGVGIYRVKQNFEVLPNGYTILRWGFNRLLGYDRG